MAVIYMGEKEAHSYRLLPGEAQQVRGWEKRHPSCDEFVQRQMEGPDHKLMQRRRKGSPLPLRGFQLGGWEKP